MIDRYGMAWGSGLEEASSGDWVRYADHIAEVCKYRDKLLEIAKDCGECAGNGVVTVHYEYNDQTFDRVEDCPACLDIRELLA